MKKENEALRQFITKSQFEQKANFVAFLTTKKSILFILLGLYNIIFPPVTNNPILYMLFSFGPFVYIFFSYNKNTLRLRDTISSQENNKSIFNRLYSRAVKYVYKNN